MKKLLYSISFLILTSFVFTGCTEEEVRPTNELTKNGGGGLSADKGN